MPEKTNRILKVVPIVHPSGETMIPYPPGYDWKIKALWEEVLSEAILSCYDDWASVQLYVDSFCIPEKFKDPQMTPEVYKELWVEGLKQVGSPLADIVESLQEKGAILESTDINEGEFWRNYYSVLHQGFENPWYVGKLDRLDKQRDVFIVDRINRSLQNKGLLLMGRRHIDNFYKGDWDDDINVNFL